LVYFLCFGILWLVDTNAEGLVTMVPGAGIEPARPLSRKILSLYFSLF